MSNTLDAKSSGVQDVALVVARILIASMFIIAAYNKFKGYDGTIAYFTRLGIPAAAMVAPLVELCEVVGAIMLIAGYQTRIVVLALGAFVLVAGALAHNNFADANQLNHFLKNMAIAGGCLAMFCSGAGSYSMDARRA